jgi:glycosyltransferase involved in cell wall biosynthesis
MTTEGTYPQVIGGVSSWCDLLIGGLPEIRWQVLPILAGERSPQPAYELPAHAELIGPIELWANGPPGGRARKAARASLPGELVRSLIGWHGDRRDLVDALVWCRMHPPGVRRAFRSREGWAGFLEGLADVLAESADGAGPAPELDIHEAATLYQVLYWVARTAAVPTPHTDLLHVTAAGWAAIPAVVHKAFHGTPMLLTEHGVYVRESYLAAARSGASAGERFMSTRLARGLALLTYDWADVVSPVADANARWAVALGVHPDKIRVIYNGVQEPDQPSPPPRAMRVVTVGRIDPLKDVHTMLRVAAEVTNRLPDSRFEYFGPVTDGQEAYGRSCFDLHRRLGLGETFRFMGSTRDPHGAIRNSDLVLMTSISEGLPMGILEAMAQARPVVATAVGGVPEVLRGCGMVAAAGDVHGLALAITTLLRDSELASRLGGNGYARVTRTFTRSTCLRQYRELIHELAAEAGVTV